MNVKGGKWESEQETAESEWVPVCGAGLGQPGAPRKSVQLPSEGFVLVSLSLDFLG